MKMTKLLTLILAPCLFVLIINIPAMAQSASATLSGTVVDSNGAVVPGAAVTIADTARGFERNVTTSNDGSFAIPLLQPSTYTLLVARDGFASAQIEKVILNVNDSRSLRVELKISPVKGEVIVTPEASMIDQSPEVSTTVDRTFVGNLPLSGRSLQPLIFLSPGVVASPTSANNPGEFSVNGQRTNANYFTLDGVSANTGINNGPASGAVTSNSISGMLPGVGASGSTSALVSVDALEEFKIQTSTYSAQFGRQPGGQIQLSTRSGTNDYRGTLFEYIRNEAFDARNYFNRVPAPKPPTRLNQFGGTFSGPLPFLTFGEGGSMVKPGKDRTFFFFSYEGQRLRLPFNSVLSVPSLRIRQLASALFKPILNAFPIPTGPEVFADMDNDPNTPLEPSGSSPFLATYADPRTQDSTSIRIDHKISENHTVFGRYGFAPSESLTRRASQLNGSSFTSHSLTLGATSMLTNRLSNETRFNYTNSSGATVGYLDDFGGAVPIDQSLLMSGYDGDLSNTQGRFGFQTPGGISEMFFGETSRNVQRQINIVDTLSWTAGQHQIRFGFDYRRLSPILGPLKYSQQTFVSIIPGFPPYTEQHFLDGFVDAAIQGQGDSVRPRFDNFSAYVQDTWKASSRLTFDLGLRWEFNPTPSEAGGRNPVFVADAENITAARLLEPNESWYKMIYTAFAPRFGVAYLLNPKAGHETVLRGGFGVFYDLNSGMVTSAFSGFPFSVNKQVSDVQWPLTPAQAALPPQSAVALPITSGLNAVNEDLRLPYTLQWNFSIEQAFGPSQTLTVGYVASAGRRLTMRRTLNQPVATSSAPRPNPNFGNINYITNGPTSDYHSMQVQYQRRLSRGLQALANYTWSHAIDEVSNEVQVGTFLRGNANFDIRHNFTAALTYDVPRWKRYSVVDAFLRDWSFDTVVLAYSGRPLDITISSGSLILADGTLVTTRPDIVPGVPVWIEDGAAPGGTKINVAAFARPPLLPGTTNRFAREGTLGRNVIRQEGIHQVNFSVRRQFSFSEKLKFSLRAEAFNLFNTPMFAGYGLSFTPGSTAFGKATSTLNNSVGVGGLNSLYALGGPRSMQFSARLNF